MSDVSFVEETIWRRLNWPPRTWREPFGGVPCVPCVAFGGETFVEAGCVWTIWRHKIWRGPFGDVSLGGEALGGVKMLEGGVNLGKSQGHEKPLFFL